MLPVGTKVRYPEWGNDVGVVVEPEPLQHWHNQPEDASNIEWANGSRNWVRDEFLVRHFEPEEIEQFQLFE